MNDLDWLARNVHEWPTNGDKFGEWIFYNGAFIKNSDGYIEWSQVKTRRAELSDTTDAKPDRCMGTNCKRTAGNNEDHSPECIADTAKTQGWQWTGPEDGLPPVGSKAVCTYHPDSGEVEIVAHNLLSSPPEAIVCDESGYWGADADHWEPVRTEEDKAVEEMLSHDCDPRDGMLSREQFCRELYRSGYRKLDTPADNE